MRLRLQQYFLSFFLLWLWLYVTEAFPYAVDRRLNQSETLGGFVAWLLKGPLASCYPTFVDLEEDIDHFHSAIEVIPTKQIPMQIWREDGSKVLKQLHWGKIPRGCYILYAKTVDTIISSLGSHDSDSLWDYEAKYVILVNSASRKKLQLLAAAKPLLKTPNVIVSTLNLKTASVYITSLEKNKPLEYILEWTASSKNISIDSLYPSKSEHLKWRNLTVFTFNYPPYIFADSDSNGNLRTLSGLEIEVIKDLGKALKFSPIFTIVVSGMWGTAFPNHTLTGLLGLINKGEGDIGIADIFITESRHPYISFTTPYDFERACLITPSPQKLPRWMSITYPFSTTVWIIVIVCILLMSVFLRVFYVVLRVPDVSYLRTMSGSFIYMIGIFSNHQMKLPKNEALQVLTGFVAMAGFITTIYYGCNLTACLTVLPSEKPITSLEQIVKKNLPVAGYDIMWQQLFQSSNSKTMNDLEKLYFIYTDYDKEIRRVAEGKVAVINDERNLLYLQNQVTSRTTGDCPLRTMLEECLFSFNVAAILPKHSPLKESIDKAILHISAAGLVGKYFKDLLILQKHEEFYLKTTDHNSYEAPPTEDHQSLKIEDFQGLFAGTLICYIFSITALVGEKIQHHVQKVLEKRCNVKDQ